MPEPSPIPERTWGGSRAFVGRIGDVPWADFLLGLAVTGSLLALLSVAKEFNKPLHVEEAKIHLELPYLGLYTIFSLARGLLAYVLSFTFAIAYGYWAAKDPFAEKLLLPLLDILQSLPVIIRRERQDLS